jgi:peroxiredoxin
MIAVGEIVPDFILKDQNDNNVSLVQQQGKRVLLSFHPLAWTKVCAQQMRSLEENINRLSELNTVAFGISVDAVPTKKAWAEKEINISQTRLLSDFWPHGGVAKKLGIFREKEGFSERANIIINENQEVIFVKVYDIAQVPDIEELINVLKSEEV